MPHKPSKVYLRDKVGDSYTKNYLTELIPLYRVNVIQHRDYDWTFSWEWTFDNEQDAVDKVRFIHEEWKEPPLTKYDSVWYYQVEVHKRVVND